MVRCFLVLENGTVLEGVSFGHESAVLDEMIFTTCMSGYQEYLTDPAYKGKILVSAFPLVGDYGVNERYSQSDSVHVSGLVVREYSEDPTDMYGGRTLDEYLKENKVPGISGIDTRDIIRMIRGEGAMGAAIVREEKDIDAAKKKLKEKREDSDLVKLVSAKEKMTIDNGKGIKIGVIDCGVRRNMIRDLSEYYDIVIFPYTAKAGEMIGSGVDGVIISHGPGNPAHPEIMSTVVKTVKELSS
ncbi:MAG: carbamoyl-phosphate synthase small subunit, partial [Methanomassiliicoccaceae archaeon]|nr:carbamoyl-phosphate synthase small subunit [Methanomassiliicoccaceae archaeon]